MTGTTPSKGDAAPVSNTPSNTADIDTSLHPRKVFLVIDVQENMIAPPPAGVPHGIDVKNAIGRLLDLARTSTHPPQIIHIRNNGEAGEPDEPNTPGWNLVFEPLPLEESAKRGTPPEAVIDKLKNNAFAGTPLGEMVRERDEVVVVGMQSDFCVRATCHAALARGNNVYVVSGAHATYDRPEAYQGGGPIAVTPAKSVEREVEMELEEAGVLVLKMDDAEHLFTEP